MVQTTWQSVIYFMESRLPNSDQLPKVPNEVEELRERFKELSESFEKYNAELRGSNAEFRASNAELRASNAELNRKIKKVSFPTRCNTNITWLTS